MTKKKPTKTRRPRDWETMTPAERLAWHRKTAGWVDVQSPPSPQEPDLKRRAAIRRGRQLIEDLTSVVNYLEDGRNAGANVQRLTSHLNALYVKHHGKASLENPALMALIFVVHESGEPPETAMARLLLFRSAYPEYAEKLTRGDFIKAWTASQTRKKWEVIAELARKAGFQNPKPSTIKQMYSRRRSEMRKRGW